MDWLTILVAIGLTGVNAVAIALTIIGLPGTWIMLLGALGAKAALPEMFGWWTLGIAGALCILAEIAEGASGAAGAAATGASKRAAAGAIVGGLIGAIAGTVFILVPVVGTIVGAAIGSGAGAMLLELHKPKDERRSTSLLAVGKGAAVGRLLATVIKGVFALAVAALLTVAAFVP